MLTSAISCPSHAPLARHRAGTPPGTRDKAPSRPVHTSVVRLPRRRRAAGDWRDARELSNVSGRNRTRVRRSEVLGVGGVILFGLPETKDDIASGAYAEDGIVQRTLRAIKRSSPELLAMTDVCNCEYTSHGHCGKIVDGDVENDETLKWLAATAVSHARAGADIVAPSDMMDGRVGAIRQALDAAGFSHTPILSYAAKFASVFYGPFREAAESAPQFGDRRSYQMDPANGREAMREIELDLEEGADMIMVKPAMPYLDLIREARQRFA